jgi:hypothetical protein
MQEFASDPHAAWRRVSARLEETPCLEHFRLAPAQRSAWLVITYDRTVRKEGHGRFFRAYGVGRGSEVVAALNEIGASSAAQILGEAVARDFSYLDDNETAVGAVGFPSRRLGKAPEYFDADLLYLGMADSVLDRLAQYMAIHRDEFLGIDDAAEQRVEADEAR